MVVDLSQQRQRAASKMGDRCVIRRPSTGERVLNEDTGVLEPRPAATLWGGPCLVSRKGVSATLTKETGEGGLEVHRLGYKLRLPHDAPELEPGDEVEITSSVNDPVMVGKVFEVDDYPKNSSMRVTWQVDVTDTRRRTRVP